ncbi:sensor histidine kinase [Trichloromonas sp.]|uniref:sensor histidine kinase n=1 Tax=Trichloromonas sp. TaxID=3069249 RepID=UPI003D818288
MRNPSDPSDDEEALRGKLIGLGELSHRKNYYPELQKRLEELRKAHNELELRVEERTAELARANRQLKAEITVRQQAEEQLRSTHRQLQDIIEFLPDATFAIDDAGKVVAWNRAIEEMTGVNKDAILGHGDYAYALPLYGQKRPCLIDLLRRTDGKIEASYDFINRRGDVLYAEVFAPNLHHGQGAYLWAKASILYDQQGNVRGAIESFRDISERKEAQTKLQKANRELEAFVFTVSHDLRNPLNSILCFAALLFKDCAEKLDQEDLDLLAGIQRQGKRMQALITDLLALAQLRPIERPTEAVPASEVVQEVIESLFGENPEEARTVKVGSLPQLRIPKSHLYQIFDNLISNARRYTHGEGDTIEVGGRRDGDRVTFFVRDHGPGIPAGEKDRIFDLFYRGATESSREGTGVGLATVQRIARMAEGRAWVEETPGGGATFHVVLIDPPQDRPSEDAARSRR